MLALLIQTLRDVWKLSPMLPLRVVARRLGRLRMTVSLAGYGRVEFRTTGSDYAVMRQVFLERQYSLSRYPVHDRLIRDIYEGMLAHHRKPLIIDGGANVGFASVYFAKQFPEAALIAVEPEPQNAELARKNVLAFPQVTVVEAALGSREGLASIMNADAASWGFCTSRAPNGSIPVITIEGLRASVRDGELFLVKLDIEGFEADVFAENTEWLDVVSLVIIEPHDWMLPERRTSRCFQREFAKRDFDVLIMGENLVYVRRGATECGFLVK